MDELNGWTPPARGVRVAISPCCRWGSASSTRFSGERLHPSGASGASSTRRRSRRRSAIVDKLGAARMVLIHVEEIDGLSLRRSAAGSIGECGTRASRHVRLGRATQSRCERDAALTLTLDLAAIRQRRRLASGSRRRALGRGQGERLRARGRDVSRAALAGGATALCVASVAEALELRARFPTHASSCSGRRRTVRSRQARDARLELVVASGHVPEGIPVHLKLDTGMGRWGLSELPARAAMSSA